MPRGSSSLTGTPGKETEAVLCVAFAASPRRHRSPALATPSPCPEACNALDPLTLDIVICKQYALRIIYFYPLPLFPSLLI